MNYISDHANQQSWFKYGKIFPLNFIDHVLKYGVKQTSINRKGHPVRNKNRGIYRCIYENQIVECVLSKHKNGDIVVVTFNTPPEKIDDICYSYKRQT